MKKLEAITLLFLMLLVSGISVTQAQERGGGSKARSEANESNKTRGNAASVVTHKCGDKCSKECCGKKAATKGHACSASCKKTCCQSADNKRKSEGSKATHVKEMSIKEEGVPAGKGNNEK